MITRPVIVGAGRWGSRIAEKLHSMAGVSVAAVIDTNLEAAQRVAVPIGATATDSLAGYLHTMGPSDIIVATPPRLRSNVYDTILAYGYQTATVRVEKPLSVDAKTAKLTAERFDDECVGLTVGFTLLYHPLYQAARDILRVIGLPPSEVRATRIGRNSGHNVSSLLDLGVHAAAVVAHLEDSFGQRIPATITCGDSDFARIRRTTIHAGGVQVEVDEIAGTLTVNGRLVDVDQSSDALSMDLQAWLEGPHLGTSGIAVRAQEILEDQSVERVAI